MKKNTNRYSIACFVLSLLLPLFSIAQGSVDLQGGLGINNVAISSPLNLADSPQGNFFLGLNNRIRVSQNWSLNINLQYAKRGFYYFQPVNTVKENRVGFRMDYMNLSSAIQYNVYKTIAIQAGAYSAYRLSERVQTPGSNNWVDPITTLSEKWDLGWQIGASVRFKRLTPFVRYNHGIQPAIKMNVTDENGNSTGPTRFYNRVLEVGAGFNLFKWRVN